MEKIAVFLAGDSTMSEYDPERFPRTGWGQSLQQHFTNAIMVKNHAASGRSTKSFIAENRLSEIEKQITAGDYLFIQFGHNDAKSDAERFTDPFTTYQENLTRFVHVAKDRDANPVLLTSVQRRNFTADGRVVDTHGDYTVAMKQLAARLAVPLIDITEMSSRLLEQYGDEPSKQLFMWVEPGQFDFYPEGEQDNTHFSLEGANQIAKLVVKGIKQLDLPLVNYLKHKDIEVTK